MIVTIELCTLFAVLGGEVPALRNVGTLAWANKLNSGLIAQATMLVDLHILYKYRYFICTLVSFLQIGLFKIYFSTFRSLVVR